MDAFAWIKQCFFKYPKISYPLSIIEKEIERLRRDYIHGSAWYFERISALLAHIDRQDIGELRESLETLRPGMASLSNLNEILSKSSISDIDLKGLSKTLVSFVRSSSRRLSAFCSNLRFESVLSISNSTAIRQFLEAGRIERIFLLESRPGGEIRQAAKQYAKYADVSIVPDSAVSHTVKRVDAVVSGMDGIYAEGIFTNKLGTLGLCISANYFHKPVYVFGESFKATSARPKSLTTVEIKLGNTSGRVPLFDMVPLELVNYLVTDHGVILSPNGSAVEETKEYFFKSILRSHEA